MNDRSCCTRPGRRAFLKGTGMALGAATLGLGFNAARAGSPGTTLVYLFLEGGMDGLSLVVPRGANANRSYYDSKRSSLRIQHDADNNGQGAVLPLDGQVGLHPWCGALHQLFNANADARLHRKLAVVLAAGHPAGTHTRSHFDSQEQIELGTPGDQGGGQSGWLTRYLQHSPAVPGAVFSAMVSGSNPPASLGGWHSVATLDSADSFHPNSGRYGPSQLAMLRELYAGSGSLDLGAALDAVALVADLLDQDYQPAPGVQYPNSGLGSDLRLVAQLVKQGLGVQVATLARGGWDDHNGQGVFNNGGFGGRVRDLSDSLAAFFRDLALDATNYANDVVVVVQSEFGRQITENANQGTDHGLANPMLVLGGGVTGGVYGAMPNLSATGPQYGDSVLPTTDFRHVLASAAELAGFQDMEALFPPAFPGDPFLTQYGNQGPLGFA